MNTRKQFAFGCRWGGRISGALLCLLILVIAIGEGVPNPLAQPLAVQAGFLALALVFSGIMVGWQWELAGGVVSILGWLGFVSAVIFPRAINWFVTALALPGALYLASSALRSRLQFSKDLTSANKPRL